MISKMTLLPLPPSLGRDRKRVSEHSFQTLECDTPRTECELNHVSKCQTLSVIKSQAKRPFWKKILRRSNYMKIDIIESYKHASRDASHWIFLNGTEWITYEFFWLVHNKKEIPELGIVDKSSW